VRNNSLFRLGDKLPTLATVLKSAGYRTGAFVGAFVLDARFGLNRGFDVYDDRYGETAGQ
jgi:arylsulfatase A-like enzyme